MFTRPPDAIAGNQNFTQIQNLAGQVAHLDVNDLSSQSVAVNELNLQGTFSDTDAYPGAVLHRVVGYAPTSFVGTKHTKGFFLNKAAGLAKAANANAVQLLTLPVGAKIVRARLTNNGTFITASASAVADVGVQAWTTQPNNNTLFNDAPLTGLASISCANNVEGLTVSSNVPDLNNAGFGKTGVATVTGGQITVAEGAQNVGVLLGVGSTASNSITAGDLALVIEYTM